MNATIFWKNDDQNVLVVRIHSAWTTDELPQVIGTIRAIGNTVNHPIDIVVDARIMDEAPASEAADSEQVATEEVDGITITESE